MDFTKLCDNSAAKITSAGTLCHEKKGSFREIYATYNHLVGPEHCKDDSTLLEAVLDLLSGVEFTVPGACLKSAEKAEGFRVEGNKNYKEKKLQDAIVCYNRSILFAPPAEKSLPLALANRSATFYSLNKFAEALSDAETALDLGYPKENHVKIFIRMTRCHCKLNQIKEARDVLATLTAMTLNAAQKEEVALLAEELVKTEQQGSVSQQEPKKEEEKEEEEKDDSQGPSSPLQVAESEAQGRFVVAGRDILIGETILAEEPHAAVPYAKQFGTHCQLCLKRTETFLPCSVCTTAVFCSKHCLKIAQGSFHPHECRINGILEVLGCSQIARLALRMLVMRPATTHLADREKAESSSEIYHLADNNAYRWGEDRKMRAFMVGCIFRTLKCHSVYLEEVDDKGGESFLAFLLLKNVQVLQFNAHEIYEVVRSGKSLIPNKSLGVGLGIYARASYFNHSCYGGVTRFFRGTKMFLKAIRPVQKGVEIEENYGPTFYFRARKDRQAQLATRYWFNCACAACKQNWPLLKNLSVKLGPVQDLKPFKMATELMSEGKAVSAFRVLCRLLSSLGTEHGECPTKEYITIEDKLRTCITNMGTVRIVHT